METKSLLDDAELIREIKHRRAVVGVIGLGYVGLPLALTCAEAGFRTVAFDVDPVKIAALSSWQSYLGHVPSSRVGTAVNQRMVPTSNEADLSLCDVFIICVPTPADEYRRPDLRYVTAAAETIARVAHKSNRLVVLESTSYPGTTRDVVGPIVGNGFLAFSPEREDPGRKTHNISTTPKIVGGVSDISTAVAAAFYLQIVNCVVTVPTAEIAEAAKLTENCFRAVNIALANELKDAFDAMQIDAWHVVTAASTKPFGFMPFWPGPGVGGHCIPVDPIYLSTSASAAGAPTALIDMAVRQNRERPGAIVGQARKILDGCLAGKSILLLGLAYKADVEDVRESPALDVLAVLSSEGCDVAYHDPHVTKYNDLASLPLTPGTLSRFDLVIILTAHSSVDYQVVGRHACRVLDTRGALRNTPNVTAAVTY